LLASDLIKKPSYCLVRRFMLARATTPIPSRAQAREPDVAGLRLDESACGIRKVKLRGSIKIGWSFLMTAAAFHL